MNRSFDVATSFLASIAEGTLGLKVGRLGSRPALPLELYEFEACPYCRKVRAALTTLDLEAVIYPCPKNGERYRPIVVARGGKAQFPYLVDPNTGVAMYESNAIVRYLFERYGTGRVTPALALGPITTAASTAASMARFGRGGTVVRSRAPQKPLELWSFEASPYCRLVREALSALEIAYLLHNVGKGSPSRDAFVARSGRMMVPYLVDPNTDRAMFESAAIVDYLRATYAA